MSTDKTRQQQRRNDRVSDARDERHGAYDPVGNQTKPDRSSPSPHEKAQFGDAAQGEPIPTDESVLPEGLKRQPAGPYDKDRGRRGG